MNVIVANKYEAMLQSLNLDVIKSLSGEFEVDDLVKQFQNFYFQRMILDITALKKYNDIKTLQKLSISLDMDKVILLLDDSEESSSPTYLSNLISMGIYNFTRNIEGINYLYNNPNTYRDVAEFHHLNEPTVEKNVQEQVVVSTAGPRIIGVKNVTASSGATTLVYMMQKQLSKHYKVIGIEVDKRDFMYFGSKSLLSTTESQIGTIVAKNSDKEIILIDVDKSNVALSMCHDVLYLVDPSTIKLNRLMMIDSKGLFKFKDKKIVLNRSLLNSKDILDFEYEARIKVFFNLPPLDEREKDIRSLNAFLLKLGFVRVSTEENVKKNRLLGLFGK